EAASDDAFAEDARNAVAITGQQGLGRAHLRAERELALGQAVTAVLRELGLGAILFRTAGAEGALVHLAAATEVAGLRELRCPKGTGVEAVAATDAEVLRVQHHTVIGLIEAIDGADRHARRVRAMHAGH